MKDDKQKKKKFIKILFPDGQTYIFNQYDTYEEKLKEVNKQLAIWDSYINENWDKTLIINGKSLKPVPKMLDMLTYYLTYDSDKELAKRGIMNLNALQVVRNREIPESSCDSSIGDLFYASSYNIEDNIKTTPSVGSKPEEFDKRYSKFKHLEGIEKNFIMGIHLATNTAYATLLADSPKSLIKLKEFDKYCFYVEQELYQAKMAEEVVKELLHHYETLWYEYEIKANSIADKNRILRYAKKSYMNILTQIERIELVKANALGGKPYNWKWAIIDKTDCFEFENIKYQIIGGYDSDRVLCYSQDGRTPLFFDNNIRKVLPIYV